MAATILGAIVAHFDTNLSEYVQPSNGIHLTEIPTEWDDNRLPWAVIPEFREEIVEWYTEEEYKARASWDFELYDASSGVKGGAEKVEDFALAVFAAFDAPNLRPGLSVTNAVELEVRRGLYTAKHSGFVTGDNQNVYQATIAYTAEFRKTLT